MTLTAETSVTPLAVPTSGWFGDPWTSAVCYAPDGALRTDVQVSFPVGERCICCRLPFAGGDSGERMSVPVPDGWEFGHVHKECQLWQVLGDIGEAAHRGLTARSRALATWQWVEDYGMEAALAAAS